MEDMGTMPKVLTPTPAGLLLHMGAEQVKNLCRANKLRSFRANGETGPYLIYEDSIHEFLAQRNAAKAAKAEQADKTPDSAA